MQSEHPYQSYIDGSLTFGKSLHVPGALQFINTFDPLTSLASWDELCIYDSSLKNKCYYCANQVIKQLPGVNLPPLNLPGPTLYVELKVIAKGNFKTILSMNFWGFRLHSIPVFDLSQSATSKYAAVFDHNTAQNGGAIFMYTGNNFP